MKEREISLGRFLLSKGFVLNHKSSKSMLRSDGGGKAAMASIFFTGQPSPRDEIRGEFRILSDLGVFGSSWSGSDYKVQLSLSSIPPEWSSSHVVVLEKSGESYLFHSRVDSKQKSLPLLLGRPYVLAQDLQAPVLEWKGSSILGTGWQKLPVEIQESGSGLDLSSLEVSHGNQRLKARFTQDDEIHTQISQGLGSSRELEIKLADYSGRAAVLKAPVTVIEGRGLGWARAVPNPISGSQSFSIHSFVKGLSGSLWIGIYDSSSALIHSDEQDVEPGRNTWEWDLVSNSGMALANGVYFFKLKLKQADRSYIRQGKFAVLS